MNSANNNPPRKELTTQAARLILGKRANNMSDKQIEAILNMLRFICNKAIDGAIERRISYEN